jgi:prevent-host-death family protein
VKFATLGAIAVEERVSAAEAHRNFSQLLRGVREGRSYVVTSHGRPIARLVPINEAKITDDRMREVARRELLRRLESQPIIDIGRWTRDELYGQ